MRHLLVNEDLKELASSKGFESEFSGLQYGSVPVVEEGVLRADILHWLLDQWIDRKRR